MRELTKLRGSGRISFTDIVDPTRPLSAVPSFANPAAGLNDLAGDYRKDLWWKAPFDVYLISEKETIMGVLAPVLSEYLVPYQVIHGYSSLSSAWRLAQMIEARNKHAWVLGIGDRDPDGVAIRRDVESKIRQYAPGADVDFVDLALTIGQIEQYGIEYRKTKHTNASMIGFEAEYSSAEIDALEPNVLRQIVEAEVTRDLDEYIGSVKEAERADLERLAALAAEFEE